MGDWTAERVLALAPDPASVGPARELSSPAKWVTSGASNVAVWGEAKGSGAKPYQVAVDFNGPAFKCSCPSRKIPCKHVLGLMLLFSSGIVPAAPMPEWASEWLEKRTEKAAVQAAKATSPKVDANPEAAAKRAEGRWEKVLTGLDECEAFLMDIAGQGLLSAHSTRSWDQMAARMVDAQAPGVARRLKRIGEKVGIGSDWGLEVAGELGRLELLIEGSRRIDALPPELSADLRSTLGIPVRKEDLDGERVSDVWDALGQATEREDRVTTIRTWLRGRTYGRWAMHLGFSVAGQPPEQQLLSGVSFTAELVFYPSAWPLRVQIGQTTPAKFEPLHRGRWADSVEDMASALSAHPWIEQIPACLSQARLGRTDSTLWAIDGEGAAMPIRAGDLWELLARTGNEPCELFGEFDGTMFRPLGAWGDWGYLPI
ncbi:MAG: SWIM zinc finger domain-containing protein [Fimbriimonas sp.]|nr:SWIM zinc finger domain-containing protein [Fimbriimonas sp.]